MKTNRRDFLGAAAAGSLALGRLARGADQEKTLTLGVVGVGWYGMVDAKAALKVGGARIAAVCDVDSDHLKKSADELEKLQGTRPKEFNRYQDLLGMKGLDAVIVGTPPQWHALVFLAALEAGLDVYCEKPLAYDVREGRAMVEAAQAHPERIVQIGFQRRQAQAFQQAKQYVDSGLFRF